MSDATDKKDKAAADKAAKDAPETKQEAPAGEVPAEELKARLAALQPPNAEKPAWSAPRFEDLVLVEVNPRHQAEDVTDRRQLLPGDRGYITKAQLVLHPEGFRKIGADGRPIGPEPTFKMNSMLVNMAPIEPPEPVFPKATPNPLDVQP